MVARLRLFIVSIACACLIGCGSSAPLDGSVTDSSHQPARTPTESATGHSTASSGDLPSPPTGLAHPQDPVGAVKLALGHVQSGRLQLAYDFLPASYQKDLDGLVQTFAEKMDAEVWDELFAVLEKGIKVLRTKKDLMIGMVQNPDDSETSQQLSDNWEGLVEALNLVVSSELSSLDKLKQANMRRFLESTGNPLFAQLQKLRSVGGPNPLDTLADVQVEIIDESAEVATLRFITPTGDAGEETKFIKVDGKWIPQNLAESWADSLAQAQRALDSFSPKTMAAQKGQVMEGLAMLEAALDQMLDAETQRQLSDAGIPLMVQGFQAFNALQQRPAAPTGSVTVIVAGELTETAHTKLLQELERLSDDPAVCTYNTSASGGETTIMLQPVADPVAFAEKLSFAKAKSVNVGQRTIRIELGAQ